MDRKNGELFATCSDDGTVKVWKVKGGSVERRLIAHSDSVSDLRFSQQYVVSASRDAAVKLWTWHGAQNASPPQASPNDQLNRIDANSDTTSDTASNHEPLDQRERRDREWRSEEALLASAEFHGVHRQQSESGHTGAILSVAWSPAWQPQEDDEQSDGVCLATASQDHTIKLWDSTARFCIATLKGHSAAVNAVVFAPDGEHVISASDDYTIKLWTCSKFTSAQSRPLVRGYKAREVPPPSAQWRCVATFRGHRNAVRCLALAPEASFVPRARHPDALVLLSGSWDCTLMMWSLEDGSPIRTFQSTDWVESCALSSDGSLMGSGDWDGTVRIWDPVVEKVLWYFPPAKVKAEEEGEEEADTKKKAVGHAKAVTTATFDPTGRYLLTGGRDGQVHVYDSGDGRLVKRKRVSQRAQVSAACFFTPPNLDTNFLAANSSSSTPNDHTNQQHSTEESTADKLPPVAYATRDKTAHIWHVQDTENSKLYGATFVAGGECTALATPGRESSVSAVGDSFGQIYILDYRTRSAQQTNA